MKLLARKRARWVATAAVVAATAVALVGCSSGGSGSSASGPGKTADTATFAESPATTPNYIWPFSPLADYSVDNAGWLQDLLYRPLYFFGTSNGGPDVNENLSLAKLPVFSNGGKTATVTLKNYKWSNGETVTAQDVEFWYNLDKAEKANYAAYVPGQFPDNVTSVSTPNSSTIVFNFDKAYSQQWVLYNQLSQITPMPAAWDLTAAGTKGDCATEVSGCAAVYKYLSKQAADLPTYATSPIWSVVDGPWKLKSFNADGNISFVPNSSYSGPQKATLKQFNEVPYTTDAAEFSVLRSGKTIDVGYLPTTDVSQAKAAGSNPTTAGPNPLSKNYDLSPLYLYGINYMVMNFDSSTVGSIFKQLPVRQAIQSLMDQTGIIHAAYKGYAAPTYGPIPVVPSSNLVSSVEKNNPYPYSVSAATKLLTDNGWKVVKGGTTTCEKPGTGSGECGAGVTAGEALTFSLPYASGDAAIDQEMDAFKSDASQAGITINLKSEPFNTVIGAAVPGKSNWEMANWGGGWTYSNDYYPTGESIFATGAGSNSGSYSNPTMDKLIENTNTQSGTAPMITYENALAKDLPVIWQPNQAYSLTEIATGLKGASTQNPFGILTPEEWSWKK